MYNTRILLWDGRILKLSALRVPVDLLIINILSIST